MQQGPVDFIEVIHNAVPSEVCAPSSSACVPRVACCPVRWAWRVPELKHSKDLRISGLDGWQDVDQQLQIAVFNGLLTYLRRYPQALIAPLMLQIQDSNGQPRRLSAEDFPDMPQQQLADLARTCLRPGAINLQWYAAGEGGYPYWHCELYPKDAQAETLHRHVLWTLYLNDDFDEAKPSSCSPRTGADGVHPSRQSATGWRQVHRHQLDPVPECAEVVWRVIPSCSSACRVEPCSTDGLRTTTPAANPSSAAAASGTGCNPASANGCSAH